MTDNFNTYINHIKPDFWRELCIRDGELRNYPKGAEFIKAGTVGRYVGYIKTGTPKYVA